MLMPTRAQHRRLFLVAAPLLLIAALVPASLPLSVQIAAVALLVAVLGLPHGALDPFMARRNGLPAGLKPLLAFVALYTLIALAAFGAWVAMPVTVFVLFLAVSIWHFSDDWRPDLPRWLQILSAAAVVMLPCLFYTERTGALFALLTSAEAGPAIAGWIAWAAPALLAVLNLALATLAVREEASWSSVAEVMLLQALGAAFSPLPFFIIYYCGIHSARHMIHCLHGLERNALRQAGRDLTLYTAAAIAGIAALWGLFGGMDVDTGLMRMTFIGLFCLTIPHTLLMGWVGEYNQLENEKMMLMN